MLSYPPMSQVEMAAAVLVLAVVQAAAMLQRAAVTHVVKQGMVKLHVVALLRTGLFPVLVTRNISTPRREYYAAALRQI